MSTISAGTTNSTALVETGDTTGNLIINANTSTTVGTFSSTGLAVVGSLTSTVAAAGAFTTLSATGVATLSAGSVGAPSVNFGDSATGLYKYGTNKIGASINGISMSVLGFNGTLGWGAAIPVYSVVSTVADNTATLELTTPSSGSLARVGRIAFVNSTNTYSAQIVSDTIGANAANTTSLKFLTYDASSIKTPLVISGSDVIAATSIGIGNTTPSGGGVGIAFPATQSASTDANTLDDYEEGTWTPGQGSGLTVVGTFSSAGRYVKIGRVVTITGRVQATTSVSFLAVSAIIANNLPFSSNDGGGLLPANGVGVNDGANANAVFAVSSTNMYSQGAMAATPAYYFSVTYFYS